MDNNFKIYDILLKCKYLSYSHTTIAIKESLMSIINNWNFQNKVVAITSDNTSNMIKAMSYLPIITQILYTAHTLQLIISKTLAPAIVFVTQAKCLIQFFQYSKQLECLQAIQKNLGYKNEVRIIQDVFTR